MLWLGILSVKNVAKRKLSTVNALTSHYTIQESMYFQKEYSNAKTQTGVASILKKYSSIFNDNQRSSNIALLFSAEGKMSSATGGKSLRL